MTNKNKYNIEVSAILSGMYLYTSVCYFIYSYLTPFYIKKYGFPFLISIHQIVNKSKKEKMHLSGI